MRAILLATAGMLWGRFSDGPMGQCRTADLSENCAVLTLLGSLFVKDIPQNPHPSLTSWYWKTRFEIEHEAVTWRRIERIRLRLKETLEKHAKEN